MLERLTTLAQRLHPWRTAFGLLAMVLLVVVVVLVLTSTSERTDRWLFPALIGLLWSGCARLFIDAFAQVPPPVGPPPHTLERFKAQVDRALHWLLAMVFLGLTLSLLSLTGKLFAEWSG